MPKHREPLVSKTVQIAERQVNALEDHRKKEGRASISFYVREALDKWLGYEAVTVDPLANEQEKVA
jgi:Arc/MetJ-type ribon-helix-helix transcriptional regulator